MTRDTLWGVNILSNVKLLLGFKRECCYSKMDRHIFLRRSIKIFLSFYSVLIKSSIKFVLVILTFKCLYRRCPQSYTSVYENNVYTKDSCTISSEDNLEMQPFRLDWVEIWQRAGECNRGMRNITKYEKENS